MHKHSYSKQRALYYIIITFIHHKGRK